MNIGQIANLKAGGEIPATIVQSMDRSCHIMIRTEILNSSENYCLAKARFWGGNRPKCNSPGFSCCKTVGTVQFQIGSLVPGLGWNRSGTIVKSFTPSKNPTAPNPGFFGQFHIFANSSLWLQFSIWVVNVSQYDIYIKDAVLDALWPPSLRFAIRSLFVKSLRKMLNSWCYFTATQGIVIGSQIGKWEVKEHPKLHVLCIYYIVIRSQLKYLIGAKVKSLWKCGTGQKTLGSVWFGFLMR